MLCQCHSGRLHAHLFRILTSLHSADSRSNFSSLFERLHTCKARHLNRFLFFLSFFPRRLRASSKTNRRLRPCELKCSSSASPADTEAQSRLPKLGLDNGSLRELATTLSTTSAWCFRQFSGVSCFTSSCLVVFTHDMNSFTYVSTNKLIHSFADVILRVSRASATKGVRTGCIFTLLSRKHRKTVKYLVWAISCSMRLLPVIDDWKTTT